MLELEMLMLLQNMVLFNNIVEPQIIEVVEPSLEALDEMAKTNIDKLLKGIEVPPMYE